MGDRYGFIGSLRRNGNGDVCELSSTYDPNWSAISKGM